MRGVLLVVAVAMLAFAATAVGAQPLPGTKTKADRDAWRAMLDWPSSCERDWRTTGMPGAGLRAWKTSDGRRLVEVSCYFGAYQGVVMLYLVDLDRRVTGPLALRGYQDPGSGKLRPAKLTKILGYLVFAPKTGILTVFEKFRGLADCGLFSTFRLDGDAFTTVSVRAKTACNGKPPFDPTRWPKLPLP